MHFQKCFAGGEHWATGILHTKCITFASHYLLPEIEPCHAPNNIFFCLELPELSDTSRYVVKSHCYCELLDFILGTQGKKSFSMCLFLFYKCASKWWVEIISSALYITPKHLRVFFSVNWTFTELVYWKTDTHMYKHLSTHNIYICRYIHKYPHIRGFYADTYYTHIHACHALFPSGHVTFLYLMKHWKLLAVRDLLSFPPNYCQTTLLTCVWRAGRTAQEKKCLQWFQRGQNCRQTLYSKSNKVSIKHTVLQKGIWFMSELFPSSHKFYWAMLCVSLAVLVLYRTENVTKVCLRITSSTKFTVLQVEHQTL